MQNAASVLTDQFSDLLKRLPAGLDLDRLALETKAIRRRREVVDGARLLRITLARGPGGLSLRQTSAWASMQGIAELSNPGVKYRPDQAVAFLAALVEHLLAAKVPGADLRWPGRILRLADGTCVSKPVGYLQCLPPDMIPHEVNLRAAVGHHHPALEVRLIVQRKTVEATEATRTEATRGALRRAAARKGKALDPRSLIAAEFMILATSLPANGYSARAVLAVYRLRWQIELAFKRLKSLLHIDQLPTRTGRGSRSWLYAHLILALLCDDVSQDLLESSP